MEIGTVCMKIAGRDSKRLCVIIDNVDDRFVMIDGQTRRRKCNIMHLEPTKKKLDIKKGASHGEVVELFKKELDIEIKDKKPKESKPRPKKQRKSDLKKQSEDKPKKKKVAKKKTEKKEEKPKEEQPKSETKSEEAKK